MNLFSNPDIVDNIKKVDKEINPATNAWVKITKQKTEVPQYGEVWYDEETITNICLLSSWLILFKWHSIQMKYIYLRFTCQKYNNIEKNSEWNIYFTHQTPKNVQVIWWAQWKKIEWTTQPGNLCEKQARTLYHIIGSPRVQKFKAYLRMNAIADCTITMEYVGIAEIYLDQMGSY